MSLPVLTATGAAAIWAGLWFAAVYSLIQSDGTWYNDLKMDDRDTFINRVIVTLRDRMVVWKSMGLFTTVAVVVWAFTYIFTIGLLELL